MAPHLSRPARILTGALLLGAVGAALAPADPAAFGSTGVCVGVVIDYGQNAPQTMPTVVQGPSVPPGTSDLQDLAIAGDQVTQNDSGLVCAVNNYPADGLQNCTSGSGSEFYYWSFWQGDPSTGKWSYANIGPAEHKVQSGQTYVEGWRYQNPGPDNSDAPPPAVSPAVAFAQACPGVTPVGSSATTTTTVPAASGSGSTPTSAPLATPTSQPSSGGGVTTTTGPVRSTGEVGTAAAPSKAKSKSTSTSTTAPSPSTTTTTTPASASASASKKVSTRAVVAAAAARHGSGSSGGSGSPLLPIVLVGAVIVTLGGVALWRWRRRPPLDS